MASNRRYKVKKKGLDYPSVTSVVSVIDKGEGLLRWAATVGYAESRKILATSADRGKRVHSGIEESLDGKPITAEQIAACGYLGGYTAFANEHKPVLLRMGDDQTPAREVAVYSHVHGYAGTLDAILVLEGDRLALVDWKTANDFHKEYALQTVAYKVAFEEMNPDYHIDERWVVKFAEDGTYKIKVYRNDAQDFAAFQGALAIHKWLYKQGD